jgi:hypothetical protein
MYKAVLVVLRDDRLHIFTFAQAPSSPRALDRCAASIASDVGAEKLGREIRAALAQGTRAITNEALKSLGNPLSTATGYADMRELYAGMGSVNVAQAEEQGREIYALTPDRVQGANLFPMTDDEEVLAIDCTDAQLGASALASLKRSSDINSPRRGTSKRARRPSR